MDRVISGYFNDVHRGLQRQKAANNPMGPPVQLPPLSPSGGSPTNAVGAEVGRGAADAPKDLLGWDDVMQASLQESRSVPSFDYLKEAAARGIQADRYEQALGQNAKLSRKVQSLQEELSITSAKKEAFKAQAQRLESEFRKGRDQADSLQKELLSAKRDVAEMNAQAQEAMGMMAEMRRAHLVEVKLLQRGLAARGGDEKMRNRVNEMADLVDKVGRAVVQRDEALRDRTQMQVQLTRALKDLRASVEDGAKLRVQNRKLGEALREARRRGRFAPPRPKARPTSGEDSDGEFENQLEQFERRFEILEGGPAGLDVLASNLSKEKQDLQRRCKTQEDTIASLKRTVEDWNALGAQKDQAMREVSARLEQLLRERALWEEQLEAKKREIAAEVEEERAALEARIAELEFEADTARSAADGMEKASTRLTRELVKVHEQHAQAPPAEALPAPALTADKAWVQVSVSENAAAKTGERLRLEVFRCGDAVEVRGRELPEGEEVRLPVTGRVLAELDEADPWVDLCGRVGVDAGPPRSLVISEKLGEKEIVLQPVGSSLLLSAFRYARRRFYVAATDLATQAMYSLSISEETWQAALEAELSTCQDESQTFDALVSALRLEGTGLALKAACAGDGAS